MILKRKLYKELIEWKDNKDKECLLVKGARQVGKTFLIEFMNIAHVFLKSQKAVIKITAPTFT